MSGISLGIDVQLRRAPSWMALDSEREIVDSGWLPGNGIAEICASAVAVVARLQENSGSEVSVGIDAPRRARPAPREFYWNRVARDWRPRRRAEVGSGRHCEVIVSVLRLANPQWSPVGAVVPDWMKLGFSLFDSLEGRGHRTLEVFPSASYAMLRGEKQLRVSIDFSEFRPGPKDMIDACIAAVTVTEFEADRGCEVGSDGLGTIVLPRPLEKGVPEKLLVWPD